MVEKLIFRTLLVSSLVATTLGFIPCAFGSDEEAANKTLRLVPDDMALGLIVRDLREHVHQLTASPFAKQISKTPLIALALGLEKQVGSSAWQGEIAKALGISAEEILNEILGDAWVVAYRPGPAGKTDQEQGMLAIWSRNPTKLSTLLEALIASQLRAGQLQKVIDKRYRGCAYRVLHSERDDSAIWLDGNQFVFATSEPVLLQVLDRSIDSPVNRLLGDELRALGASQKMASIWIRPRAFDDSLRVPTSTATKAKAHATREFFKVWQALDAIAISFDCQEDLEIALHLGGRKEDLPKAARDLLAGMAPSCPTWELHACDSLLRFGLSLDIAAVFDALGSFIPEQAHGNAKQMLQRQLSAAFGPETVDGLLEKFGPSWQIQVFAPSRDNPRWIPHVLCGIAFSEKDRGAITTFAQLLASTIVIGTNHAKPASISLRADPVTDSQYLSGTAIAVPDWMPAYKLDRGRLLVASEPNLLTAIRSPSAVREANGLILQISLRECVSYLRAKKNGICAYISNQKNSPRAEIESGLDSILLVLEQFQKIELLAFSTPKSMRLIVRVEMNGSLK